MKSKRVIGRERKREDEEKEIVIEIERERGRERSKEKLLSENVRMEMRCQRGYCVSPLSLSLG